MNIMDFREKPQFVPSKNKNYMMDIDKLNGYMEEIWAIASAHGWHNEPLSMEHYMGMIMTEMAEAVESDRNGKRALYGDNDENHLMIAKEDCYEW